jgi:predicted SnoaL-like aldol condensation-catalyzing enzyme
MKKHFYSLVLSIFLLSGIANAGLPVTPAVDQQNLLKSSSVELARNKQLVYDFFRIILIGRRLERASEFLNVDYIQHNPNVDTGLKGFLDYFSKLGGPKEIPDEITGLVAIQAEGDFVTLSFVDERADSNVSGKKYTTTWFDMFRLQNGNIAEHWDCDIKSNFNSDTKLSLFMVSY